MRIHRFALATLAAFTLSVGVQSASAAPATYNWTGWYIGLNGGGNWGTSQPSTTSAQAGWFVACPICLTDIASAGNHSFNTSGFTGGVQGGYNWQSGNLLVGIEVDFQYFHSAGSNSITVPDSFSGPPETHTVKTSVSTDWLFTARPRLGMVANNWLFYGTGGLAVTKLKADWSYTDTAWLSVESASASATKTGWTVGGGIEAALPGNWLIGGEYLYVKFGSVSATSTNFVHKLCS
jgi:outer membrane immunogenic protein